MPLTIADLNKAGVDAMGDEVLAIYGRNPPYYAVYRTAQRVLVQFADDLDEASKQRKSIAPLNPLRGQINGLIDGWRLHKAGSILRRKAERYDRRVGDALIVALEGDIPGACGTLQDIKQDILSERISWGRFEYLISSFLISLLVMAVIAGIVRNFVSSADVLDLWRSAAAGALGAFFSIALAIHGRTVLPDLQRTANIMDAVLRIIIGLIGASVLMAFVSSKTVTLSLGDTTIDSGNRWLFCLIVGFIAGFSERFVPDLLAKVDTAADRDPPLPQKPEAPKAQDQLLNPDTDAKSKDEADPHPEQAETDHCACDVEIEDTEVTPDDKLPPASGGVAVPKAA